LIDKKFAKEDIEEKSLKDYFYELNTPPKGKKSSKFIKATSKQFRAAVNILDIFLNNASYLTREEIISVFEQNADEEDKLGVDAYKHALSFLETSKVITNIYNNKKSIHWSLNKTLEIYIPKTRKNRKLKAQMIVSILNPSINYETYKMACTVLKSDIYELKQTSLYESLQSKIDIEYISDVEIEPYLHEELEVLQSFPTLSQEEFKKIMYEKTHNVRYLPKEVKEIFIF